MVFGQHVHWEYMGLVDLDASYFVQLGLFLVFLVLMNFLLFRPLLRVFDERDERTRGTRETAAREDGEARERILAYETQLGIAVTQGAELRASLRAEAQATAQAEVAKARAKAERRLDAGTRAAEDAYDAARLALAGTAAPLAAAAADKLLGPPPPVGGATGGALGGPARPTGGLGGTR